MISIFKGRYEIDSENVKAKLSKGILNITFKKIPGKKVEIDSEEE